MNLIAYLLGMAFGMPWVYLRLAFFWVWHTGLDHFREDMGEVEGVVYCKGDGGYPQLPTRYIAMDPANGIPVKYRRCKRCRRRFPDFDAFSWSNESLK